MKVLVLAGALAAVAFPAAAAAEVIEPCRTQDAETSTALIDRAETTSAPAPVAPVARQPSATQRVANETRTEAPRRRSGKRVPDSELIGPRGAL